MRFSFDPVIACELAPNYQLDDALRSTYALLAPYPLAFHTPQMHIKRWFSTYLSGSFDQDNHFIWLMDSGRTALYLLLKSSGFESKSEVLLLGYSCIVVPNAVLQAGFKPILVDVNPESYNFDLENLVSLITKKTKAVVVQHTYGLMENMSELMKIAQKYNLVVIEDCAHSLGSSQIVKKNQKNAGSFGHAAIFSFGRDKAISSTIGGAAVINKMIFENQPESKKTLYPDYQNWVKEFDFLYQDLPNMKLSKTFQALIYPIISVFFVKPFYSLNLGKLILFLSQKIKIFPDVYTLAERDGNSIFFGGSKYSSRLGFLLLGQIKKFPRFVLHRDSLAKFYANYFQQNYVQSTMYLRYPLNISQLRLNYKNKKLETHKKINQKNSDSAKNSTTNLELKSSKISTKKTLNLNQTSNKQIWTSLVFYLKQNSILIGTWYTAIFQPWKEILSKRYYLKKTDLPNSKNLTDYQIINLPTNINTSHKNAQKVASLISEFLAKDL